MSDAYARAFYGLFLLMIFGGLSWLAYAALCLVDCDLPDQTIADESNGDMDDEDYAVAMYVLVAYGEQLAAELAIAPKEQEEQS